MIRKSISVSIILLAVLLTGKTRAQFQISGSIRDSVTLAPLAFVNTYNLTTKKGALSDIDGNFRLVGCREGDTLVFSYVGYHPKRYIVTDRSALNVFMQRTSYELSGVEILPGVNPAHRIILNAIEARHLHDPEKLQSFSYKAYNKTTVEWYFENARKKMAEEGRSPASEDSAWLSLEKTAEDMYLMMLESFSERYFFSGKSVEKITGTRVSGFKNPDFATLATDIQPLSFYKDYITLKVNVVNDYISPLAPGATQRYFFQLEDTLYAGADSVFVISYRPFRGKNFDALKGLLYITTDGFALQNVIAEPAEKGLWQIRIQQQYSKTANGKWFPVQLNYDWLMPEYPSDKAGIVIRGRSYLSDIEINGEIDKKIFRAADITLEEDAGDRDETFWENVRDGGLSGKELKTYDYMDSVGRKLNFDYFTRVASSVIDGYIPIAFFDLSIEKLYSFNKIEGSRAGLGLRTNNKLSRRFTLGGFACYGFWDYQWKYGANAEIYFDRKKDHFIGLSYSRDYDEPGMRSFHDFPNRNYWSAYLLTRLDDTESKRAYLRFRLFKNLTGSLEAAQIHTAPLYDYSMINRSGDTISNFTLSESLLALRFAPGENIAEAFGRRVSTGGGRTVFYASWSHGFKGIAGGTAAYDRIQAGVQTWVKIRGFGKSAFFAEGGYCSEGLPYNKLFRGYGTFSRDIPVFVPNSFNTMRVNEFVSDRYVSLFFTHNFGKLLVRTKFLRPEIMLHHNMTAGWIKNPGRHLISGINAPENGYFESGISVGNLVRLNILDAFYLGVGLSAFYRYGSYSLDKTYDNLALKINFGITGN